MTVKRIMDLDRCAKMTFEFDRYDTRFDRVISEAASKGEPSQESGARESPAVRRQGNRGKGMGRRSSSRTPSAPRKRPVFRAAPATEYERQSTKAKKRRTSSPGQANIVDAPPYSPRSLTTTTSTVTQPSASRAKRSGEGSATRKTSPTRATAATATGSIDAETQNLESYDANQVSLLVSRKGTAFEPLAKLLKDADFEGTRIVEQLNKGDEHFLDFLQHTCGMDSALHRLSVLGTFKDVRNRNAN